VVNTGEEWFILVNSGILNRIFNGIPSGVIKYDNWNIPTRAMEVSSWENHWLHGGKLPNGHFKCHGEFDDI
jgi:hypothetical protein